MKENSIFSIFFQKNWTNFCAQNFWKTVGSVIFSGKLLTNFSSETREEPTTEIQLINGAHLEFFWLFLAVIETSIFFVANTNLARTKNGFLAVIQNFDMWDSKSIFSSPFLKSVSQVRFSRPFVRPDSLTASPTAKEEN